MIKGMYSYQNKNTNFKFNIIDFIVMLIGFTAPIGEKMNVYFPFFSKLYVIFGLSLSVLYFLDKIVKEKYRYSAVEVDKKANKMNRTYVIFGIFIFIHTTLMYIISLYTNTEKDILTFFKIPIFMFIAYILFIAFTNKRERIDSFLSAFNISFVVLFLFFNNFISSSTVERAEGVYDNVNAFAYDAVFVIFASIFLLNKNKKRKALNVTTLTIGIIALFSTGTRSAIIGSLVGLVIYLITIKSTKKLRVIFTLILGTAAIILLFPSEYLSNMINRLVGGESNLSSYGDNVRLEVWKQYLRAYEQYIFFGLDEDLWSFINRRVTHNTILYILVKYGFIGILLFIAMLASAIRTGVSLIKSRNQEQIIFFSLIVTYVVGCMFIDALSLKMYWVVWILLFQTQSYNKQRYR